MKQSQNTTTMLKGTFSNAVHKLLEPNMEIPKHLRWKSPVKFSNEDKIKLFDEILELHKECSNALHSVSISKKKKKRLYKERLARGYVSTKKTTLKEWIAKQNMVMA